MSASHHTERFYFNHLLRCGGCSNSFNDNAKNDFCKGYEFKDFSWADGKIAITKKKDYKAFDDNDIATINAWFKSIAQYSGYRIYRTLDDLRLEHQNIKANNWFDLCLSVFGFLLANFLNLLAVYLNSILLQQLIGIFCGVFCTLIIFYLGYDILPRTLSTSWSTIKTCISNPKDLVISTSGLYEYLLIAIVAALLLQALIAMGYGLYMGHVICIHHFHCPLMIAISFYAKQWLRSSVDGEIFHFDYDENAYQDLIEGEVVTLSKGDRALFIGSLKSSKAEFDASSTTGDDRKFVYENDEVSYGWVYQGNDPIKVEVVSSGDKVSSISGAINRADLARGSRRSELFNISTSTSTLWLGLTITVAIIAPLIWYWFAVGFGLSMVFDMAFSIVLIACPCRDFVKNFCYYLAMRQLPSSVHLKGAGVYEILDATLGKDIKFGFDWTNTLQRDSGDLWSIETIRVEALNVLKKLHANMINIYSGTDKLCESKITCYKQQLGIDEFFVDKSSLAKKEQVEKDGINIYVGDNHNDILAGLASDVFIAVRNKDAKHSAYNPMRYADIVLEDTLEPLPELLNMVAVARKASYAVSIINAIYNICALFLASGGYFYLFGSFLNPVTASFVMFGSMIMSFISSIAFTWFFLKLAYNNKLSDICSIPYGLSPFEEKRIIENILGYEYKSRSKSEIAELALKTSSLYKCGYLLFSIGGYAFTTRGLLGLEEYTTRYSLYMIACRWQHEIFSANSSPSYSFFTGRICNIYKDFTISRYFYSPVQSF